MYQLPVEAAQVRLHLNSIVLVNHPIPAIFSWTNVLKCISVSKHGVFCLFLFLENDAMFIK